MDTLALTDRDGVYGAVRFAKACLSAGVRPILGVDLAIEPSGLVGPHRTGARSAAGPDQRRSMLPRPGQPVRRRRRPPGRPVPDVAGPRWQLPRRRERRVRGTLPRITLLAGSKAGWAALCRLVSATHLRGERGVPVTTQQLVAEHLAGSSVRRQPDLLVMLGPASELGWAATLRRDDLARGVLRSWQQVTDADRPARRGGLAPGPGLRSGVELARRPDGRAGRLDQPRCRERRAHQRRPLRRSQ